MAKIRDPARDEIKEYYETHKISIKKLAEHFNVSENTIKSWKKRDKKNGNDWVQLVDIEGATSGAVADNKKKQILKAKTMVITGSTLKETSEKVGIPLSTLGEYSAKENWIDKQEKYMQKVYGRLQDKLGEQHIEEIEEAIKSLVYLRKRTMKDVISGEFENLKEYGTAIKNICEAMDKQSKYLGLPEMKMYIRQDKEDKDNTSKDRTINIKVIK